MCRQSLAQGRETLPLSCFPSRPSSPSSRLKKRGETSACRRRLSPRNPCASVRMEHRISRPRQRPELAASHHAVRIAIAVNQHGGAEPFAVEPPANRYPRSEEHTSELQT